jgi:hypothetical protein
MPGLMSRSAQRSRKRLPKPDRRRAVELPAGRDADGSEMRFWEFPFGVEVEAPDSAMRGLEELATLAAGANWGMEFADTAMHFRFHLKEGAAKFIKACKYHVFIPGARRWLRR